MDKLFLTMKTLSTIFFFMIITTLSLTKGQTIDEIIAGSSESVDDFDFMSDVNGKEIRQELDMMLLKEQYEELYHEAESDDNTNAKNRPKRKAIKGSHYRWADKVIPYHIAPGVFDTQDQQAIKSAIDEWQNYTCLRFRVKRSSDDNFIHFSNGKGCYSYVGMVRGSQTIGLAKGCRVKGVIVHEIGHAVGFHHEQNRPDRDDYVKILEDNIPRSVAYNFKKYSWSAIDTFKVPYDYGSIMHYGSYAFTKNGEYTIKTVKAEHQNTIGNREGLSFNDIMLANKMYKCNEACDTSTSCPGNSFRGKDCKCWCKGPSKSQPYRHCDDVVVTDKPGSTTTTTTSKPVTQCKDANENCGIWAASKRNYCKSNTFVKTYCRKSCETCDGDDVMDACNDMKPVESCKYWQSKGFCDGVYEVYMTNNCQKTCKRCSKFIIGQGEENNGFLPIPSIMLVLAVLVISKSFLSY